MVRLSSGIRMCHARNMHYNVYCTPVRSVEQYGEWHARYCLALKVKKLKTQPGMARPLSLLLISISLFLIAFLIYLIPSDTTAPSYWLSPPSSKMIEAVRKYGWRQRRSDGESGNVFEGTGAVRCWRFLGILKLLSLVFYYRSYRY